MTIDSGTTTIEVGSGSSSGDSLSPAELAYFRSGGSDTAALEAELGGAPGEPAGGQSAGPGNLPSGDQNAAGDPSEGQGDDSQAEEGEDGEVVIGKDGKARDRSGKFVPHAALHKERVRRQSTEAELQTLREQHARADERLRLLMEATGIGQQVQGQPLQPPREDPMPDPEKDLFGFMKWQTARIEKLQAALEEKAGNFEKFTEKQRFEQAYVSDVNRFKAQTPDFLDAYQHLVQGRDAELQALGMTDRSQRAAQIADEERQLVQNALSGRRSPSETLYALAKSRGYAPKAQQQQQQPNGAAQKIQQIAQGQKVAGNSLSNAGGQSGEGLTIEALASMNQDDFEAAVRKMGKSRMAQLLGG